MTSRTANAPPPSRRPMAICCDRVGTRLQRACMIRASEKAAADRTPILSWRRVCAVYAILVAVNYGYVAEPGGAAWFAGTEILWIAIDLALVTAMVRGSVNALILCGAIDVSALVALVAAESSEPQAGFSVMACLCAARLAVLLLAWTQRRPAMRPVR